MHPAAWIEMALGDVLDHPVLQAIECVALGEEAFEERLAHRPRQQLRAVGLAVGALWRDLVQQHLGIFDAEV